MDYIKKISQYENISWSTEKNIKNKLEGSTFSKDNLIDLLEQNQVVGEHF